MHHNTAIHGAGEQPRATSRITSNGIRVECETHVNTPPEFVWELIQEPTRRVEWDARLTRCDLLTPRPLQKGARTRTIYAMLGWLELEYTSWQPGVRSAVKSVSASRGNAITSLVASWNFLPHDDGSTTWKTQIVLHGTGGPLRPLVERGLLAPVMVWLTRRSARNLKRLAEAEYAAVCLTARAA